MSTNKKDSFEMKPMNPSVEEEKSDGRATSMNGKANCKNSCNQWLHKHFGSMTNTDDSLNYKLIILVLLSRIVPILFVLFAIVYIIVLIATPANWETDDSSPDDDILRRETNRGLLVSILISLLLNLVGWFMFSIKVRESLVVTNYGFILGPVVGFLLDQGIGTDAGFKNFATAVGFSYTFATLIGGNFMRYIVTVFLDLFISNPLQDVLKTQVARVGVMKLLKDGRGKHRHIARYDAFVAMNYPSILQSIVAFVTFNAYTNQTRFAWAYPSEFLSRELRIPPGTIMLSTAIAGVLYLNFYTIMDYISERDYFDVNTKLMYVLAILLLLYGLNQTNDIEAPIYGEEDTVLTSGLGAAKPLLGVIMFSFFVLYGFVYPIYTRMGCCGRCKPQEAALDVVDHVADVQQDQLGPAMYQAIAAEIKKQIAEQLDNRENENQRKYQKQI